MTIVATTDLDDRDALAHRLAKVACRGAGMLLRMRAACDVKLKADGSPVCSADLAADRAAKQALAELLPDLPVISEESTDAVAPAPVFVLLDPLDGTREFLAGGDSYCVAVAIIRDGRPIAGAIAAPQLRRLWFAGTHAFAQALAEDGSASGEPEAIVVRPLPAEGPATLVSRFHSDGLSEAVVAAMTPSARISMSSAVKFGLIASGEADLNVRAGQTMEWDTAAGDAILAAAGGIVLTFEGARPRYGVIERQYRNPPFVAASSEALARKALLAVKEAGR